MTTDINRTAAGFHTPRRNFLKAAGFGSCALLLPQALHAESRELAFRLYRKGDHIGYHNIRFETTADGDLVTHNIDLKVKLAFITLFSFEQEATDRWVDGKLIKASSVIKEEGETMIMEAEQDGDHLLVEGEKGVVKVPLGSMTDLCFWNDRVVDQKILISTKHGLIAELDVKEPLVEKVKAQGEVREALKYHISTNISKSGEIWYDRKDGSWIKGSLNTRGETIGYEREV